MRKFGLIGRDISYSFSKTYFANKFHNEGITNAKYLNFDIRHIEQVKPLLENPDNCGFNVTIPYKEAIIPYLNTLSTEAQQIGAVNTIKRNKDGGLTGYNTDYFGFTKALQPLLQSKHKTALILGTGGASKAVAYSLQQLNIAYKIVSRNPLNPAHFSYHDLTETIIKNHAIIINCTPLGTFPNVMAKPAIPYQYITQNHILFDLIYNPSETQFLRHGRASKAQVINGWLMLKLQAEKSWSIWNSL
ncbi:shikimate dehydrogenase family protein [Bizionia sediminis]|uniref:Shikimate dehydrogenase family protein n=1 Tax=Bizionia sediminis TaxID=1737064 RepID=A0ABW5KRG3_9FLAO